MTEKNIVQALKTPHAMIRVSTGARWLVWESRLKEWQVWERAYRHGSSCVCYTQSETEAVRALLEVN